MNTVRLAANLQSDSIVDGKGLRTVIWFQGCSHNCFGCHNPETHDFNGGFEKNIDELKKEIDKLESQSGITFSGGDPFYQPEAFLEISTYCKNKKYNIWAYTGFTFEQLIKMSEKKSIYLDILKTIDVLVDGMFEMSLKSYDVPFRGSKNQRLIDVQKSLNKKTIVLFDK